MSHKCPASQVQQSIPLGTHTQKHIKTHCTDNSAVNIVHPVLIKHHTAPERYRWPLEPDLGPAAHPRRRSSCGWTEAAPHPTKSDACNCKVRKDEDNSLDKCLLIARGKTKSILWRQHRSTNFPPSQNDHNTRSGIESRFNSKLLLNNLHLLR